MKLYEDLNSLIKQIYIWAGRPTRSGARDLRNLAAELEEKYENFNLGLVAVFYDRKNGREVKSSELMKIKLIQHVLSCDTDEDLAPSDRRYSPQGEAMSEATLNEYIKRGIVKKGQYPPFKTWKQEVIIKYPRAQEAPLGDYGYKSEKCSTSQNWDLWCMVSDLVFLRFE